MLKKKDKDSAEKLVIQYLKKNKNIFLDYPELLDVLNFPNQIKESSKIIDLNAYRSKKIKNDYDELKKGKSTQNPHHINIRLGLYRQMQDHGLVGPEVGGHDRLATQARRPVDDFLWMLAGKFFVGVFNIDVHEQLLIANHDRWIGLNWPIF